MQLKLIRKLINCGLTAVAASVLILNSTASTLYGREDVPEIDPGSAGSALTLLVGGTLLLAARLRRKR